MGTFAQVYRDPTSFGLDASLVTRLLPDYDLEALPRRAFAFPVLRGMFGGIDLARAGPGEPRRTGGRCWRPTTTTRTARRAAEHIDRHLALADRLWRGDPPELWEAAQRLLDRGEDRHAVLHTLMYVIRDSAATRPALSPRSATCRPALPTWPRPGEPG